jgi:hypothetical protein
MKYVDPKLYEYCDTDRQKEILRLLDELGSGAAVAERLGIHRSAPSIALKRLQKKAARRGYSPEHDMVRTVPEGYLVKGVSTYYDSEGKARGQWVKSSIDADRQLEIIRGAVQSIIETSDGVFAPVEPPKICDSDLLTVVPMGDPHFGLMTWAKEVGENFDLSIAEQVTYSAVDRLCAQGPNSETAMLLNLGDYFHADNANNRTPQSGNSLDVDGRFQKIAEVGLLAMVRCIQRLLEKHQKVIVRNNRGNHDPHQAFMLTLCLSAWFRNEPRVEVDTSPSGFFYYRHGRVLIGSTHGDGAKLADLPLLMATDAAKDWAEADFRVWHCGHFHHDQLKDYQGCTVETHRTLAPNDAWHRYQGYRSFRDMKAIVYHKDFGEMQRIRCGVERLQA